MHLDLSRLQPAPSPAAGVSAVPGTPARLGSFLVGERLGQRRLGVVHAAVEQGTGREVALQLVVPQLSVDSTFRRRFAREARVLAVLQDRHVLPVHTFGEEAGWLWFAGPRSDGGDLAEALRRHGPPPLETAVDLVRQVALGLHALHTAGLVHGALDPTDVLLTHGPDGVAARVVGFGDPGAPASTTAPEVHLGAEPDARSDVYSLGCLLWTVATGATPYDAPTEFLRARAHLDHPVPQLGVPALDAVLRRALAKDPAHRHASAHELAAELPGPAARPVRVPGVRPG